MMNINFLKALQSRIANLQGNRLDPVIAKHIQDSYPSNHCYTVKDNQIIPHRKLANRFNVIQRLYSNPVTSLVDLSSCKGYFVFEAAQRASCERAMGIDIHNKNLHACQVI